MAVTKATLKTVIDGIVHDLYAKTTADQVEYGSSSNIGAAVSALESTVATLPSTSDVNSAISAAIDELIDGAPSTYDTLKEIADYIAEHGDEYEALVELLNTKVDKVSGKGLSTEDFTSELLAKLNGIAAGATNVTVDSALSGSSTNAIQNKVVKAALDNKQDSLSSAQLSAVNSGIDSNKVADIATNKSGITFAIDKVGKNLLNLDIERIKKYNINGTWTGNTFVHTNAPNLSFTVNDDYSITVNGSTTDKTIRFTIEDDEYLKTGTYVLSGCPTGGSVSTYELRYYDETAEAAHSEYGNGKEFNVGTNNYFFAIFARLNQTFSNKIFKPMVCDPACWELSHDYEQYAKSNAELTKAIEHASNGLLNKAECSPFAHHVTGGRTAQGFCVYNYNGVNYAACAACKTTTVLTSTLTIYNLSTGDVVQTVTSELFDHMNDMTYYDGCLYIVNGDSTDKVIVCDLSNYSVSEITVTGYGAEELHGIEYYNGNFYVLTTGTGVVHLHKYDIELSTILLTRELYKSDGFSTTQGIFAYGDHIFFLRGQNDRSVIRPYVNSMRAYKISDFTPVKSIYVPYGTELEAVSYIDGDFYFYYNTTSFVGVIYKGTILEGEKIYGTENLSELIGFGRFEKSDSIYINESYTGFFVNNTPERPFTSWAEANTYMVNPNTPRYNVYLLSDMTTGIAIHPSINSYIYVYGAELVNGSVQNLLRSLSGAFAARNCSVVGCSYLNFISSGTCEFANNNYVRFENCVIDRSGVSIDTCNRLVFSSTSINYVVSLGTISHLTISGTFEAVDSTFNPNRLVGNVRIEAIPTNLSTGWKPIANSITGDVYASSVDICKKLLGQNLRSVDAKTLSTSDVIADLNLPGRYLVGSNNTIVDAPTTERGFIELVKGYSDTNKRFIYTCTSSTKAWVRTISNVSDSGWFELYTDTKPAISLFSKVGVIGDGFASGEIYTTGSKLDEYSISWLQILARQNGFTGTNYSHGGINSKTWMTDNHGLPLLQSSDPENLYLIAFGINDSRDLTLGTVSDIGTEADTFYAYYSKIISEIKTKSSEARIICFSTARFGGDYDTFSEAIQTIAEQMNVPYIDVKKHPYFKTSFYTDNQVSSHPTALNYSAMASAYKELIEGCMKDNQAYFNDYVPVTSSAAVSV